MKTTGRRANACARLAAVLALCLMAARVSAAPNQQDVFRSIQDSVGKPTEFDARPIILLGCGGGLVLLLVVIGSRRQQTATSPKPLNHPGRLLKEVLKDVPLKSAEVKQLKLLAETVESQTGEQTHPLVLLLCPSLMVKGLKEGAGRIDRKTIAQVVRKLRIGRGNEG